MKRSILKISTVILIILTMTMANFIFVGKGLIAYAAEGISTNHQNVEFEAYFKDVDGKKVTSMEIGNEQKEAFLYLNVNIKKEGYFNGEIHLENNNFTLKESNSEYVNKIENNTIYLNQINIGATREIEVKIEPIQDEKIEVGLLNAETQIGLNGIYRDSKQKDIKITATRELILKYEENNNEENVLNDIQVITNKIEKIAGEEKRIIQLSYNMGLKENSYPMKKIEAHIEAPKPLGKAVSVEAVVDFNNMKSFNYTNNNGSVELTLENQTNEQGKINWKKQGAENVILTCIYGKDVDVADLEISATQKVTLYDDKEIETKVQMAVGAEELDNIVAVESKNLEETI